MSKGKILVTPRSVSKNGHPYLCELEASGYEVFCPFPGIQPSTAELLQVLPDCVGYLAGVESVPAEVLKKCRKLKVISRNGVGIENVDCDCARELGIELKIAAGANSRGVAELAVCYIFTMCRQLILTHNSVKNGGWVREIGNEVFGKTLSVIGTGQIGAQVALMAKGLGMEILGYDLYPNAKLEQDKILKYVSLEEAVSKANIISLHCPASEKPLIDHKMISKMQRGVYLINTSRAALVDQESLLAALNMGAVSAYAVDAFTAEPPELTPLLKHDNVILSAHIGGFTTESVDRAVKMAVDNILGVLENK